MNFMSKNKTKTQNKKLLDGIKVLDLSRILAGPWATQMLADYGATVWKIERPEVGDDTRHWGPPFYNDGNLAEADIHTTDRQLSAYFMTANRGKQSLCIDITQTAGQKLIKELVKKADIVVENFKVGGLKKYGLDYDSLSQINPEIIYCSITGFGQTGPMAQEPGYDAMIQAMGGLMSITGQPNKKNGEPQKVGVAITDLMTGMYATTAILAALNYRTNSGLGQHIDLALFDTQLAMLANQGMNYLVSGVVPQRQGNAHPNIVPYQTFRASDAHFVLAVGNDQQFVAACNVMQVPKLALDNRFLTNQLRVLNREVLISSMESIFHKKDCTYWLTAFKAVKVPCGPVNDIQQAFEHPQALHRKMQFEYTQEQAKPFSQIANPVNFSVSPINYELSPPLLGSSTEQVLTQELGLTAKQLTELNDQKVI
jgi:crotonobetainyl-CoA:carnitine CoA-transferase CaiB-like acyl-CoA transferase